MFKTCSYCGHRRLEKSFNKKTASRLQPYCRDCQSVKAKEHYELNRQYYLAKAEKQRKKLVLLIREAKNKSCCDCNNIYPYYVMDFDHREGKDFNLGGLNSRRSVKAILTEIAKCDVVCSNCHRARSHRRRLEEGKSLQSLNALFNGPFS